MTKTEIEFDKYSRRGAYHWGNISLHPLKRNPFVLGRYRNMLLLLKRQFGDDLRGKRVLEVGCGDGVLSCYMARQGSEVSAIDNSNLAIDYAKENSLRLKLAIDIRIASAYELPFEGEVFDAVVSSDVIEHLKDVDVFLKEIKRVLKPNGVAIISTPIRVTESLSDPLHVTEWFQSQFSAIIGAFFPNTACYYSHPVFWMELYKVSFIGKMAVTFLSYFVNPFEGFISRFEHKALQYSVSVK